MRRLILLFLAFGVSHLSAQAMPSMARISYTSTTLTIKTSWAKANYSMPAVFSYEWTRNGQVLETGATMALGDTVLVSRLGPGRQDTVQICRAAVYDGANYGRQCNRTVYNNGTTIPNPPPPPPPPILDSIRVSPDSVLSLISSETQFSATGFWNNGAAVLMVPQWGASGGSITIGGRYTAGTAPGVFVVTASASGKMATARVTIRALPPPPDTTIQIRDLLVRPRQAVGLLPGATVHFCAFVWFKNGPTAIRAQDRPRCDVAYTALRSPPPSAAQQNVANQSCRTWFAQGGTITPDGFYIAGSAAGTYSVTATPCAP